MKQEYYAMSQNIQIVHCSPNRCDGCVSQNGRACQYLITRIQDSLGPIVLVERQRGLLHVHYRENFLSDEPPWYSDNWYSVFIGLNNRLFDDLDNLIGIYRVGPYMSLFFGNNDNHNILCKHVPIIRTSLELSLLNKLVSDIKEFINPLTTTRKMIHQQLEDITENISNYIQKELPEINDTTRSCLAQIVAHRSNILGPLFPILLDELTEEVYFDGPETMVYFDHQRMGRCTTSVTFSDLEIPRIITFIRFESNQHLDRSNPSLKMNLNLFKTNLRLSVSIPPLSVDGLHLEIRRAKKEPYFIGDLIENGTMTSKAAALLLLAVACRFNITITGGPGAGKTTILNALDMATPRWWRKVYIEDAVESRILQDHHQVRLQVDSIDERQGRLSKGEEIVKCLHRSPDYVILGEIQTKEHSKALFQAIAAGLHSIQTCHSDSAASLISRWIMNHGIERTSLGLMDLIVTLERIKPGESQRQIKEIVEIRKGIHDGVLSFLGSNVLYDGKTDSIHEWLDDGAYVIHAKSQGINNPEATISSLIKILEHNDENIAFEELAEELWDTGHPMKFVGN